MGRGTLTVSFDLDGTLTSHDFVDGVWDEAVPELVSRKMGVSLETARSMCRQAYDLEGDASANWYRLRYWLKRFGIDDADPQDLLAGFTPRIRLYEDALRTLERLASSGARLVLFSNASREFLDKEIEHAGIEHVFSLVVSLPDDWNMVKAQADSFERLAGLMGSDVIHVGDHPVYDYEVPRNAGIRAYHVWRGRGERLKDSLDTLDDLEGRIMRDLGLS